MFHLSLTVTLSHTPRPPAPQLKAPQPPDGSGPTGSELASLILNSIATVAAVVALFLGG